MKYLIDTHTYIWYINQNERISTKAIDIIEDNTNDIYLSIASIWEMSIKIKLGKLKLVSDFNEIKSDLTKLNISLLPITIDDTLQNFKLEFYNRDPFDRIIISQAINNNLPIITLDDVFEKYSVDVVW